MTGAATTGDSEALPRLIAHWWEYRRRSAGSREERKELSLGRPAAVVAADDLVRDRIDAGGCDALDLVVALVDTAPDDDALAYVGAGPLEDLLHVDGEALVADVEQLAASSPRFRAALSSVYLSDALEARFGSYRD